MRPLFFSRRWRSSEIRSGGSGVGKKGGPSSFQKNGDDEYQPIVEKFREMTHFKKGEKIQTCMQKNSK